MHSAFVIITAKVMRCRFISDVANVEQDYLLVKRARTANESMNQRQRIYTQNSMRLEIGRKQGSFVSTD